MLYSRGNLKVLGHFHPGTIQTFHITYLTQRKRNLVSASKSITKRTPSRNSKRNQNSRKIILTKEQQFVCNKAIKGKTNLFFTGSASTGKSILLREIIQQLRLTCGPRRLQVTASTGVAALNIGGITLHSFAGIGLGNLPAQDLLNKIKANPSAYHRWVKTKILIIDEISMVSGKLFDLMDEIARRIRNNKKPFGGIKLVVSGNFFQLPPVSEGRDINTGRKLKPQFAFEANCWTRTFPQAYKLTQVLRQTNKTFARLLNELRLGIVTDDTTRLLNGLCRPIKCNGGIIPTEIYPLRRLGQEANLFHSTKLNTRRHNYQSIDESGTGAEAMLEKRAPQTLTLQIDAHVMCTRNFPDLNLVNGSIGRVIDFITLKEALGNRYPTARIDHVILDSPSRRREIQRQLKANRWPLVQFFDSGEILMPQVDFTLSNGIGRIQACRRQIPLILAWALTVHKTQGRTIDPVRVDLAKTFAPGQAYVAISHCKSLEGLQVINFSPSRVFASKKVIDWDKNLTVAPIEHQASMR